ncbi:hypothetical protein CLAFUW4_04338 [Fulvia fulva]|uniref:uncharacterized protein n=1 Tax=Passalora fulva TaxID=5499 RepID=UPI0004E9ECAD|nr:uncharacterized protein CLAFUR5_20178 [Fulvia fulva]KAK4626655.1 hypothetical protein CLAFUR4_04324 [Fulvia fulva]KAK4628681.1 hypothetical protein CLAFUR0_04326 [Fulvia fulva]WMI38859.1 hypothetical protein CLAFUR5_20178 [Fulvia fulva]WPV13981.1 hypothetical protein CLAFUW4_04338 [Fulvia fulva]WPV28724.1 hypothetical protein CLAFUW7_04327 [Fulvia fulva]
MGHKKPLVCNALFEGKPIVAVECKVFEDFDQPLMGIRLWFAEINRQIIIGVPYFMDEPFATHGRDACTKDWGKEWHQEAIDACQEAGFKVAGDNYYYFYGNKQEVLRRLANFFERTGDRAVSQGHDNYKWWGHLSAALVGHALEDADGGWYDATYANMDEDKRAKADQVEEKLAGGYQRMGDGRIIQR